MTKERPTEFSQTCFIYPPAKKKKKKEKLTTTWSSSFDLTFI